MRSFDPGPITGAARTALLSIHLLINAVPAAGSEAMFRRVFSAGFQHPRLSERENHSVLFFVNAFSQNLSIQLFAYYTQGQQVMSRAGSVCESCVKAVPDG